MRDVATAIVVLVAAAGMGWWVFSTLFGALRTERQRQRIVARLETDGPAPRQTPMLVIVIAIAICAALIYWTGNPQLPFRLALAAIAVIGIAKAGRAVYRQL